MARPFDLGIKPFLINSILTGVVARGIIRKVCSHCTESYELSGDECRLRILSFIPAESPKPRHCSSRNEEDRTYRFRCKGIELLDFR